MTHSYTVSDDFYCVIFNDGVEVARSGAYADKENAAIYGEKVLGDYNDKTLNPNNISYPHLWDKPAETPIEPIVIPNAPKEINSPNA